MRLLDGTTSFDTNSQASHRVFLGQRVALAGCLATLTRGQAAELIHSCGGQYQLRVNSQTTLLVVGARALPLRRDGRVSRNLQLAEQFNQTSVRIHIIAEQEFLKTAGLHSHTGQRRTLGELSDLLGISRERLRAWVKAGLITPVDVGPGVGCFDYQQTVIVKFLWQLVRAGVKTARLRESLHQLSGWMPNAREGLSRLDVLAGSLILRRDDGRLADVSGQLLIEFADDESQNPVYSTPLTFSDKTPPTFEQAFQTAVKLEEAHDFHSARLAYEACLKTFGSDPCVHFNLGNVLVELRDADQAIAHYREAVAIDHAFAQAWNNLGELLATQGDHRQALAAWTRAVQADPGCAEAVFNLADALEAEGHSAAAQHYWTMYLARDRQSQWADHARRCLRAHSTN